MINPLPYRLLAAGAEQAMPQNMRDLIANWLRADRAIQELYASIDPANPTRFVVEVDGKVEMVELLRHSVNGTTMVEAKRFRVHGV